MAHETLKTLITNNIKTNGQNAITAQILQDVLIAMVDDYPDLSGYATRTWVQQQGYVTASALNGYATQSWVNTQLGDYLPLTGGTLTGALTVEGDITTYSGAFVFANEDGSHSLSIDRVDADLMYDNKFLATQPWVTTQLGDYLQVVNGVVSVSSGDMDIYSAGQTGGMATIFEAKDNQDVVFNGSPSYFFSGEVHASAFIKDNGTSNQVLCADGSVKTLSELKAALNAV